MKEPEDCEVPTSNATSDEIRKILDGAKSIAVVGVSAKEDRPSHAIYAYLRSLPPAKAVKDIPLLTQMK